jgi:integrase
MPILTRHATAYKGVYWIEGEGARRGTKQRIFYIRYRRDGKAIDEKAGRQVEDDMTAARASIIRAERISGKRLSNEEKRQEIEAEKIEANKVVWTVSKLWEEYEKVKADIKGLKFDQSRFTKHVKPEFGDKTLGEISQIDVDRLRMKMGKSLKPQSVKNSLAILKRLHFFALDRGLSAGLPFRIKMPKVNNLKTEFLTEEELKRLLKAISEDDHPFAGKLLLVALYTGLRKGEIVKLKWTDLDFERGFIRLRDPKGAADQMIPLNAEAKAVFESIEETDSPFVFAGRAGHLSSVYKMIREIRKKAKLPEDFRPFHGLRHHFASILASSGKVDLYTLQKLLSHKTPDMTQRYAHLRDEALRKASDLAGVLVTDAAKEKKEETSSPSQKKVVNLDGKRG